MPPSGSPLWYADQPDGGVAAGGLLVVVLVRALIAVIAVFRFGWSRIVGVLAGDGGLAGCWDCVAGPEEGGLGAGWALSS